MIAEPHIPPMERAAVLLRPVRRWTAGRKARILDAIKLGIVSEASVALSHNLHPDEIATWRQQRDRDGVRALRMGAMISATRKA